MPGSFYRTHIGNQKVFGKMIMQSAFGRQKVWSENSRIHAEILYVTERTKIT